MRPHSTYPEMRLDHDDEALLRATLVAHAPAAVDTNRGWAAIADRLTTTHDAAPERQPSGQTSHDAVGDGLARRRAHLPRALTRIAAAVAVAAVLMGTGYGITYYLTNKGDAIQREHLYTVVNQRQTDQGITIVVDRAYADSGSTSILYYIELAPALAARGYTGATPLTFDLTDQYGDEGGSGYTICHPGSGSVLETCEITDNAFVVPAGATQLTIDYSIYRTLLQRGGDLPRQDMVQGVWNFEFTIPFHQKSLGPGGGVQPTPPARPAGRLPGAATSRDVARGVGGTVGL